MANKKKFHSVEEQSGIAIRLLARIVAGIVAIAGFLILYENPIRTEPAEAERAIAQVKQFADFIQTRPDLTAPRDPFRRKDSAAPVLSNQVVGSNSQSNTTEFSASEFRQQLSRWLDPAAAEEIAVMVKEHPREAYDYFHEQFNQPEIMHDSTWEANVEGLMKLSETGDVRALDLIREQLIQARRDDDYRIQRLTDEWFQRYIGNEKREAQIREAVDAFGQIVDQKAMAQPVIQFDSQ
jgi:hypothetical protein